jgi:hypothetical protein
MRLRKLAKLTERVYTALRKLFLVTKPELSDRVVSDSVESISPSSPEERTILENAYRKFLGKQLFILDQKISELEKEHSPIKPEDAARASIGFAVVGASGLALGAAGSTLAEALSLGQLETLSDWLRSTWVRLGLAGMVAVPIIVPYDVAVRRPLELYWQNRFRPRILDLRWAGDLFSRNIISKEKFAEIMGFHGISDEMLAPLERWASNPVSFFALRYGADAGLYDEEVYRWLLRDIGYDENKVEFLLRVLRFWVIRDEIKALKAQTISDFESGLITEDQLRLNLEALGLKPLEIDILVDASKLKIERTRRKERINIYIESYRKKLIDENDLREALRKEKLPEDHVANIVALEILRAMPKPKPPKPEKEVKK